MHDYVSNDSLSNIQLEKCGGFETAALTRPSEASSEEGRTTVNMQRIITGWTLVAAAILVAGVPASAHGQVREVYYDAHGRRIVVQSPIVSPVVVSPVVVSPVVVTTPPRPRRYYLVVPPLQRPVTTVRVERRAPPPSVVIDPGPAPSANPYDTSGVVVAGGGVGAVVFLGDGITEVALGYKLHLGLAVGASEFALRADLVPDGLDVLGPDGNQTPAAFYTVGASFSYRFLDRAVVHPVAGIGLEALVLDPHDGETGTAFAVTARAGLELAYPLSDGALALGIDVTGHQPLVATDAYATNPVAMISFGAYADYRF
jgi:hypothetical protein